MSKPELQPTTYEMILGDPNDNVTISVSYDGEFGTWNAHAGVVAWGNATPEKAVEKIRERLDAVLRELENK